MIQRTRLPLALLASATVHAAMLLALAPGAPSAIPGIPGETVRVILIEPHKPAPESQATKPRTATQSEVSTDPRDNTPHNRQASEPAPPDAPAASQAVPLDTSTRDLDAGTITARALQAMLHEAFVVHFHYPSLARQNSWQGEVRLGLRIEPNGELTRICIITSSGYGILDRAAMHSLEAVGKLPHAATLLKGSGFNLILPVRYQLLDS